MAKNKKAKPEPIPIAEARGLVSFYTNEILVLVAKPVEEVAAAFKKHRRLKTQVANADGKTVKVADPSYVIYRLRGHDWTIIDSYHARGKYVTAADAHALSQALQCRAIFYGNSDTAGATSYDLFDDGEMLEHFDRGDGIEFESKLRDIPPPDRGTDFEAFVNQFLKDHDALAPSWSIYFGAICNKPGQKVKLEFPAPDDLEQMDYVGA
jgi:hypothetical protein